MQVAGGFILGFDNDSPGIFDKLSTFIQDSGIVNAMVGLLNALPNTKLYKRLSREGRLTDHATTGNNTDLATNFTPKMGLKDLVDGYKKVINKIYSPKPYYERLTKFLKDFKPGSKAKFHFRVMHFKAIVRAVIILGIVEKGRRHFWKLFFWTLFTRPKMFPMAVTLAIYGYHFRKYFGTMM